MMHGNSNIKKMYSSTLFLTSALEGGEGSASRPGRALPPGKTRYPFYKRLGGPEGRSGQVRKISVGRLQIPIMRGEFCDNKIDLEVNGRRCGSPSSYALCSTG